MSEETKEPEKQTEDSIEETVEIVVPPEREESAETIITPQLGSNRRILQDGRVDMRIFSVLEDQIDVFIHSWSRNVPDHSGGRWLKNMSNDGLCLNVSKGGLGRKQYVLALAGSKGVPVLRETDTRSWTERHVTMRNEDKARQEGKIDVM